MTVAFGICRRYCVLFEVRKVAKACAKQAAFSALNEGEQSADARRPEPPNGLPGGRPALPAPPPATRRPRRFPRSHAPTPLRYDSAGYSLEWPLVATIVRTLGMYQSPIGIH